MSDSECPVCQLKVANLSAHLEVHSKQEVVLALLRHSININKSNVSNNILGRRNSGGSSNGGSNSSDERLISSANNEHRAGAQTDGHDEGPRAGPSNIHAADNQHVSLNQPGATSATLSDPAGIQRTLNSYSIINNINNPNLHLSTVNHNTYLQNISKTGPGGPALFNPVGDGPSGPFQPGSSAASQLPGLATASGGQAPSQAEPPPGHLLTMNPSPIAPKPQFPPTVVAATPAPTALMSNIVMCGGILPVNMGMSTPILLPQVNGPTLLINVPNYLSYHGVPPMQGIMVPNMYNPAATAAPSSSTSQSFPVFSTAATASTSVQAAATPSKASAATTTSTTAAQSMPTSPTSEMAPSLPEPNAESDGEADADTNNDSLIDVGKDEDDGEALRSKSAASGHWEAPSPIPGPSRQQARQSLPSSANQACGHGGNLLDESLGSMTDGDGEEEEAQLAEASSDSMVASHSYKKESNLDKWKNDLDTSRASRTVVDLCSNAATPSDANHQLEQTSNTDEATSPSSILQEALPFKSCLTSRSEEKVAREMERMLEEDDEDDPPPPILMQETPVISHLDSSRVIRISNPVSGRGVSRVQDSLLPAGQDHINHQPPMRALSPKDEALNLCQSGRSTGFSGILSDDVSNCLQDASSSGMSAYRSAASSNKCSSVLASSGSGQSSFLGTMSCTTPVAAASRSEATVGCSGPPLTISCSAACDSFASSTTRSSGSTVIVSPNSLSSTSERQQATAQSSCVTSTSSSSSSPVPAPSVSTTTLSIPNRTPATIDTVEALQSALADDNDVQLVVSHQLLDTPEFRALMHSMEHSSVIGDSSIINEPAATAATAPLVEEESPSLADDPRAEEDESAPMVVEPTFAQEQEVDEPSAVGTADDEDEDEQPPRLEPQRPPLIARRTRTRSPSPEPCTSRDISREATRDGFERTEQILSLPYNSDDDLTLEDLIAVETFDDSQMADEDMSWTGQLSSDSFQYLSSIIGSNRPDSLFRCDRCGIHFPSLDIYKEHSRGCVDAYRKEARVTKKGHLKSSSTAVGLSNQKQQHETTMLNNSRVKKEFFEQKIPAAAAVAAASVVSNVKMEVPPTVVDVKFEGTVANQVPLATLGNHWKCGQCKATFDSGAGLLCHLEEFRTAKIKCMACHLVFPERKDLLEHSQRVHESDLLRLNNREPKDERKVFGVNAVGEYTCDKCDRAFKEKDMLIKHLACHTDDNPHECIDCGKRFAKAASLKDHRKRHFAPRNFHCAHCPKSFFSAPKLIEHSRIHTGEAPLKCDVCGKGFKRHSNLSEHKKIHDPFREVKPPKELFCGSCGKQFSTQRDLDWHIEEVHERVPKKCTYCGDVFTHSTTLTRHIRLKHEASFLPEKKKSSNYANCPICDTTLYKTSISKHIRVVHQGQKNFTCEICKKMFVSKHNLENHMWQHKNKRLRPFKCNICNKAYLREALLQQHLRTHKGIKPYVCNECGVQFTMKANYKRHVEEHNGQRNHVCPHCNKAFTRSYYLTDHMKVHTREKPYICGICGKTAATRSNYNSHLKTHITREPVNSEV